LFPQNNLLNVRFQILFQEVAFSSSRFINDKLIWETKLCSAKPKDVGFLPFFLLGRKPTSFGLAETVDLVLENLDLFLFFIFLYAVCIQENQLANSHFIFISVLREP
jgi:hypothetical protein